MLFRDGNNEIAEVSIEEYDDNSDPRIELFKSLEAEQQHSNKFVSNIAMAEIKLCLMSPKSY